MKMTLLGNGVRTPFVLHGLADRQAELGLTEVVLHDADPERTRIMSALGADLCRGWGAGFTVRGEEDPREAIAGARFVFSAIRVGQDRARAIDERIALAHGVLGQETTGPAGFAMALRTIPAMLAYARTIVELAPDALLVNFTNPVGIVGQALRDHASVRAIGVCDGPIEMKRSVAGFLGVPADVVHVDYAGLNHAGWIHRVLVEGRDRLPEILERYEELQRLEESWALFDADLVRSLGMLPMEYLYFYYSRDQAVARIVRSGGSRGEQIARLNAALWPELARLVAAGDLRGARAAWGRAIETRHETYFARERGEAVAEGLRAEVPSDETMFEGDGYEGLATAVMVSAVQRRRAPLIVNAPNRGAIPGLLDSDVVEVTCMVDEHGAHPLAQGHLPEAAMDLIEPLKAYERLTVEAAVDGSYATALEALSGHPLVGSEPLAKAILDDLIDAHGGSLGSVRRDVG